MLRRLKKLVETATTSSLRSDGSAASTPTPLVDQPRNGGSELCRRWCVLYLWCVRYVEKVQVSMAELVIWREDSCLLSIDEGLPLCDGLWSVCIDLTVK